MDISLLSSLTAIHYDEGNLAFRPGLKLAPVYDMLPMMYAPLPGGEVPPRIYQPEWPLPHQRAHWQTACVAALAFWRDRLAGAQGVLDLPLDAPRPPLRAVRGESLRLALPPALSQSLGGLARSLGTTTFSLLLGAWQILLARWSGQDTVPVGTRSAGRGDPRAAGVVGYFVNPVVVVGHVDRAMRASDYLRATHAGVLEALAHDALPFPTLVERLQVPRDPSTTPLFQASFVLQKAQRGGGAMEMMAGAADWAGLGVEFVDLPQQAGQFDLDLDMFEVGDSLRGVLKYDAALFHPDSIARLAYRAERQT